MQKIMAKGEVQTYRHGNERETTGVLRRVHCKTFAAREKSSSGNDGRLKVAGNRWQF